MNRFICIILLCVASVSAIEANEVLIDGKLDDEIWGESIRFKSNYQVIPQTLLKFEGNFYYQYVTSENGIYVGITSFKRNDLRVRTQENDTLFSNDNIQIMLDMDNTEQGSYVFSVNHQGNYFDGIYKTNKELDADWDGDWEFKTKDDDEFWVAEIFIPWDTMSFNIQEQNIFGMSVNRFDEATNATYSSTPANLKMNSFLQSFSKESVVINSKASFDLYPYIALNRDIDSNDNSSVLGAELFWKPTKNQLISATINPDFGQVESDELVVNFSAIESFFSEKRPFFNENQSIFDVSGPETLRLVHTPRIGGESYYDDDYAGELDLALKYTVSHNHLDLGFMSALEVDSNNLGRDFWVLRGQYSLDASKLGVLINQVDTPSISRKSTIISTDLQYAITEDTEITLGIVNSNIDQGLSSVSDLGWWLMGSSEINERHSHEFSLFTYGEDLQLNDVGYVKRVNRKQFEYEYQYKIPNFNNMSVRDLVLVFELEAKTNFQDEELPLILGTGIEMVTDSEFEYQLSYEHGSSGYDDLITRGNNSLLLPAFDKVELEISSPEYYWGKYGIQLETGKEGFSGNFYNIEALIEQQFNDNIYIGLTLSQYNSDSWIDWNENNIIDEYNYTEQGVALSLNYHITDKHELRIKFESFIGKAKHLNQYEANFEGSIVKLTELEDFSFSENALQFRYKFSMSKLTAFYLSYGFGGEYENDIAKFGKVNLYKEAFKSKDSHNIFTKIRFHF